MSARSALGRWSSALLRHRSAYEAAPLRRYLQTTRSPATFLSQDDRLSPTSTLTGKHYIKQHSRIGRPLTPSATRTAAFATMHRSPAAMLTKPMADPNIEIRTPRDPNTLSNYHNFVTRHTSVDFDIDFQKKRLFGSVLLTLECLTDEDVKDVVLDSRYVHILCKTECLKCFTKQT